MSESDSIEWRVPRELAGKAFVVQHNPNCPSPFLVRMPGDGGRIDMLPYATPLSPCETKDILGFGRTLEEAATVALRLAEERWQARVAAFRAR